MAVPLWGELWSRAISSNKVEDVAMLLIEGAPVDFRCLLHWTPLIRVCLHGNCEIVVLLLDNGADINAGCIGFWNALSISAMNGHLEVVRLLVSRGAFVLYRSPVGYSALLFAALYDHLEVCVYLLSVGADLKAVGDGKSALIDYGCLKMPTLSLESKMRCCVILEDAWAVGPHPSQIQRRIDERWSRRWPFVFILVCHGFRPLLYRLAALPAVDPAAVIPPVIIETEEQRRVHLMSQVFTNEGIIRRIVCFTG